MRQPPHQPVRQIIRNGGPYLLSVMLVAGFAARIWRLFPTAAGTMGGDYALFLPNLLAGYFWYLQNGPFVLPWFSPGECGGVPFFADANVPWFSVPQALSFVLPPLTAVWLTVLGFAAIGYASTYLLARSTFACSRSAACIAGAMFLFNGFYTARMAIGHLAFHPFMLTPLLCWAILPAASRLSPAAWVLRICLAGVLVAVMLQAGMVHVVPAVVLSAGMVALIHMALAGGSARWLWSLIGALGLAAMLAAGKLAVLAAFVAVFPRDSYSLPGFPSLLDAVAMLFRTLFWQVPADAQSHLRNLTWAQDRYEFELGVGIVPVLLLGLAAIDHVRRHRAPQWRLPRRVWLPLAAGALLACVPLALNWYEPHWNGLLKSLPYFRSSSNLLRWNAAYILPATLLGGLMFDRIALPWPYARPALVGLALVLTIGASVLRDDVPEGAMRYQPAPIGTAWQAARRSGTPPPITAIAVSGVKSSQSRRGDVNANNAITVGYSHRQCYQPMFGYANENLPLANLTPTLVLREANGLLNLKNPACYLFPRENRCLPGAMFEAKDRAEVEAFVAWKPFPFAQPATLRWIILGNQLALLGVAAAILAAAAILLRALARQRAHRLRKQSGIADR